MASNSNYNYLSGFANNFDPLLNVENANNPVIVNYKCLSRFAGSFGLPLSSANNPTISDNGIFYFKGLAGEVLRHYIEFNSPAPGTFDKIIVKYQFVPQNQTSGFDWQLFGVAGNIQQYTFSNIPNSGSNLYFVGTPYSANIAWQPSLQSINQNYPDINNTAILFTPNISSSNFYLSLYTIFNPIFQDTAIPSWFAGGNYLAFAYRIESWNSITGQIIDVIEKVQYSETAYYQINGDPLIYTLDSIQQGDPNLNNGVLEFTIKRNYIELRTKVIINLAYILDFSDIQNTADYQANYRFFALECIVDGGVVTGNGWLQEGEVKTDIFDNTLLRVKCKVFVNPTDIYGNIRCTTLWCDVGLFATGSYDFGQEYAVNRNNVFVKKFCENLPPLPTEQLSTTGWTCRPHPRLAKYTEFEMCAEDGVLAELNFSMTSNLVLQSVRVQIKTDNGIVLEQSNLLLPTINTDKGYILANNDIMNDFILLDNGGNNFSLQYAFKVRWEQWINAITGGGTQNWTSYTNPIRIHAVVSFSKMSNSFEQSIQSQPFRLVTYDENFSLDINYPALKSSIKTYDLNTLTEITPNLVQNGYTLLISETKGINPIGLELPSASSAYGIFRVKTNDNSVLNIREFSSEVAPENDTPFLGYPNGANLRTQFDSLTFSNNASNPDGTFGYIKATALLDASKLENSDKCREISFRIGRKEGYPRRLRYLINLRSFEGFQNDVILPFTEKITNIAEYNLYNYLGIGYEYSPNSPYVWTPVSDLIDLQNQIDSGSNSYFIKITTKNYIATPEDTQLDSTIIFEFEGAGIVGINNVSSFFHGIDRNCVIGFDELVTFTNVISTSSKIFFKVRQDYSTSWNSISYQLLDTTNLNAAISGLTAPFQVQIICFDSTNDAPKLFGLYYTYNTSIDKIDLYFKGTGENLQVLPAYNDRTKLFGGLHYDLPIPKKLQFDGVQDFAFIDPSYGLQNLIFDTSKEWSIGFYFNPFIAGQESGVDFYTIFQFVSANQTITPYSLFDAFPSNPFTYFNFYYSKAGQAINCRIHTYNDSAPFNDFNYCQVIKTLTDFELKNENIHIVLTKPAGTNKLNLFVNGVLTQVDGSPDLNYSTNTPIVSYPNFGHFLGRNFTGETGAYTFNPPTPFLSGGRFALYEFFIAEKELSEADVEYLFNARLYSLPAALNSSLFLIYPFNGNANDVSGFNRNLTLLNYSGGAFQGGFPNISI